MTLPNNNLGASPSLREVPNEFSSLGNLGSRLYPYSNNQHPPRLRGGLGWGRTKTIPANLNCYEVPGCLTGLIGSAIMKNHDKHQQNR